MWAEAAIAGLFVMASSRPRTSLYSSPIWALVSSSCRRIFSSCRQVFLNCCRLFFVLLLELLCDDSKHLFDHQVFVDGLPLPDVVHCLKQFFDFFLPRPFLVVVPFLALSGSTLAGGRSRAILGVRSGP